MACTLAVSPERAGGSGGGERQRWMDSTSTFGVDWKWGVTERTHRNSCQVSKMSIWVVLGATDWEEDQRWESFKREERELRIHFFKYVCAISEISKENYQQTDEYTCLEHRDKGFQGLSCPLLHFFTVLKSICLWHLILLNKASFPVKVVVTEYPTSLPGRVQSYFRKLI